MNPTQDSFQAELARYAGASATPHVSAVPMAVQKAGGVPFPFDRVDMLSANPREQLNQPYKHSVWVQRAIKKIAGPIAAVPFRVFDPANERELDAPDLKAFLDQPVIRINRSDFIEAAVGWLKLKGEAFLIADDTWLLPFQEAVKRGRLIMPRPDQMRQITEGGELIGWEYRDPKGGRHMLLPEQVWQIKYWNPYDPWRGMPEYDAARIAAEGDYYAGDFVRNVMANNGDQGPYIIAKNGIPSDPQRAQIIADLREKRARAQRGEFRPVFLTGDIEVKSPEIQAPDADLVATRLQSRHEIFIAFGVPASMADVVASFSIGSASARYELIEETCMPAAGKVCELLDGPASIMVGRPVKIRANWDEHSTMQAVRRERLDAAQKLWQSGMPWKQINDYLHLGMQPFTGWDIAYVPISANPVSELGAAKPAEKDPAFSENTETDGDTADEDPTVNEMRRALQARANVLALPAPVVAKAEPAPAIAADEYRIFACTCASCAGRVGKAPSAKDLARWRHYMNLRRPALNGYVKKIGRVLMIARGEVLSKISANYRPKKSAPDAVAKARAGADLMLLRGGPGCDVAGFVAKAGAASDLMFRQHELETNFFSAMRKQAAATLKLAGQQLFDELGRDDPFSMAPEAVLNYALKRQNVLSGVPPEIEAKIHATLAEGIDAGDTTEQLANRVRAAFNEIDAGRARTIAATETSAAYGAGRHEAMTQAGVRFKAWLTSGNANVRPAHEQAGLDYPPDRGIPVDDPFVVDGEELDYPGDDSGSAGNVINCHCVSIAVAAPDEEES